MSVEVVPYSDEWPRRFDELAADLRSALAGIPGVAIEHVGSTSVPGLAAKPIIDVDVIVARAEVAAAIDALLRAGYQHIGNYGLADREAMAAPADGLRRNVYVCVEGTIHVRNHLAVRDTLRARPDLRDRYAEVKLALAAAPDMTIGPYTEAKSDVLQEILDLSDLTETEKAEIRRLNEAF